jgi:murein DD-endopeptidase MepM/ murein hydrolase activator NlpD
VKFLFYFITIFVPIAVNAQLTDDAIHYLKSGKAAVDTSPIYELPFSVGKKIRLIQAYNSAFSHKGEISLDFKMPIGTKIFAARSGTVVGFRNDSKIGGLKNAYLSEGNYVQIVHDDGSSAIYWHLQENSVPVKIGDIVTTSTCIGRSGNTGYTAFPHLHFQVYDKDRKEIVTRFRTQKGTLYLRPLKKYWRV